MLSLIRKEGSTVVVLRGELTRETTYEPLKEWVSEQTEPFVLDIDSCGGDVVGLASCCDVLSRSNLANAHISGVAASAAFFLAIACKTVECVEDGKVGSLGTMMICGEKPIGYHNSNLSPRKNAEDSQIEEILDSDAARLLNFVAFQRGFSCEDVSEISSRCGEGKLMCASEALERGLIDKILPCFERSEEMSKNKCEEFEGEPMPEENIEEKEETVDSLIAKRDQLLAELEALNEKIAELQPDEETTEEVVASEKKKEGAKEEVKVAASLLRRLERLERLEKEAALSRVPLCERERASVLYDGEMRGEHKLFSKHYSGVAMQAEGRVSFGGKVEPDKFDKRSDFEKVKAYAAEKGTSFTDTLFALLSK